MNWRDYIAGLASGVIIMGTIFNILIRWSKSRKKG